MTEEIYDELALERRIRELFGVNINLRQTIVHDAPVGRSINATVFLTDKKQLYLYIEGQSKILLDDVKKIVARMGMKAEAYMSPKNRPGYFDEFGEQKFKSIFPGRTRISEDDIRFYRTLAPYNPALVLIKEITDGKIYEFNSDTASDGWRLSVKFTYRRIRTS